MAAVDFAAHLDAAPAWPMLLGVHLVVLAALGGMAWSLHPPAPPAISPIEERLLALDLPAARGAVDRAIAGHRRARALSEADQRSLGSFLGLLATASRLEVRDVEVAAGPEADGLVPVDARVRLAGDAYDLPVFLDAVHRHRAAARVERVAASVRAGGQAEAVVDLRFHRPVSPDTEWVGDRLETAGPGVESARPVLEAAAELAAWRVYAAREPDLVRASAAARKRVASDLPARLVELRRAGGQLAWTAEGGAVIR